MTRSKNPLLIPTLRPLPVILRLYIVAAIIASTFGTIHALGQDQVNKQKSQIASYNNICMYDQMFCTGNFNDSHISIAKSQENNSAKSILTVSEAENIDAECINTASLTASYSSEVTTDLDNTSQAADKIRAEAENNGEAYLVFDNQLNELFSAYDIQSAELYSKYLVSLGSCSRYAVAPPIKFGNFTP